MDSDWELIIGWGESRYEIEAFVAIGFYFQFGKLDTGMELFSSGADVVVPGSIEFMIGAKRTGKRRGFEAGDKVRDWRSELSKLQIRNQKCDINNPSIGCRSHDITPLGSGALLKMHMRGKATGQGPCP